MSFTLIVHFNPWGPQSSITTIHWIHPRKINHSVDKTIRSNYQRSKIKTPSKQQFIWLQNFYVFSMQRCSLSLVVCYAVGQLQQHSTALVNMIHNVFAWHWLAFHSLHLFRFLDSLKNLQVYIITISVKSPFVIYSS